MSSTSSVAYLGCNDAVSLSEMIIHISNGEVTTWPELALECGLRGVEVTPQAITYLLANLTIDERSFKFLKSTLVNTPYVDECLMSNIDVLSCLMSRLRYVENVLSWAGSELTKGNIQDVLDMFLNMDIRNPRILLHYFLRVEEDNPQTRSIFCSGFGANLFFSLFDKIIERAKRRSVNLPDSFESKISHLVDKFYSMTHNYWMMA